MLFNFFQEKLIKWKKETNNFIENERLNTQTPEVIYIIKILII